jgi:dipeptidase E
MTAQLLISNSTQHGEGYLDHCAAEMLDFLGGRTSVLFVPYALDDRDGYADTAIRRFAAMDIECTSIHRAPDAVAAVEAAEAMFVGGGNSFRLLKTLYELELIPAIRASAERGMRYMGASAGSNMACPTIRTTNDMPIVEPPSLSALGLIPFQLNPHYLDPPADSTHMGETRETRLREYLEENPGPVLGIREGAWLRREDSELTLGGRRPARLFRRDATAEEIEPGSALGFLLD